jgi:hypothetical protein
MGYNCLFTDVDVTFFRRNDVSIDFNGVLNGKLYVVDFSNDKVELDTCLIAKTNMGCLWHHHLSHVGMKNFHNLLKGEHILRLKMCTLRKVGPAAHARQENKLTLTIHTRT